MKKVPCKNQSTPPVTCLQGRGLMRQKRIYGILHSEDKAFWVTNEHLSWAGTVRDTSQGVRRGGMGTLVVLSIIARHYLVGSVAGIRALF